MSDDDNGPWYPVRVGSVRTEQLLRVLSFIYRRSPRSTEMLTDARLAAKKSVAQSMNVEPNTIADKYIRQLGFTGDGATRRFEAVVWRWLTVGDAEILKLMIDSRPAAGNYEDEDQEIGYFFSKHPTPVTRNR